MENLKASFNQLKDNALLRKIFAIGFLVLYAMMVVLIIYTAAFGGPLSPEGNTMVSTIVGATSGKLNTIIDYLFGGSMDNKKEEDRI